MANREKYEIMRQIKLAKKEFDSWPQWRKDAAVFRTAIHEPEKENARRIHTENIHS